MFEKRRQKEGRNPFNCLGCGRFVKNKRWYKSYNGRFDILRVSYTCSFCGECDWPLT